MAGNAEIVNKMNAAILKAANANGIVMIRINAMIPASV